MFQNQTTGRGKIKVTETGECVTKWTPVLRPSYKTMGRLTVLDFDFSNDCLVFRRSE